MVIIIIRLILFEGRYLLCIVESNLNKGEKRYEKVIIATTLGDIFIPYLSICLVSPWRDDQDSTGYITLAE